MSHPATTHRDLFGGNIIHTYTRDEALADGVLVDASTLAREAGFRWPVALTTAAWADLVAWPDTEPATQDETGRLWDVLVVARATIGAHGRSAETIIPSHVLRVAPGAQTPTRADFKIALSVDAAGAPCLTVMLPTED